MLIEVDRGIKIRVRDGTALAADIYHARDRRAWLTILIRTPYDRKRLDNFAYVVDPLAAAESGIAVVVQDVRGLFESEGRFKGFRGSEGPDGADTVRWIRRQGWSGGRVAMAGESYLGMAQLAAAAQPEPELSAIAPYLAPTGGFRDFLYTGGVLNRFAAEGRIKQLVEAELDRQAPDDEEELRAALDLPPMGCLRELLRLDSAVHRVATSVYEDVAHDYLDHYWDSWDMLPALKRAGIPALHVGGWFDVCLDGTLRTFDALSQPDAEQPSRQHLLIGPWAHSRPLFTFDELSFDPSPHSHYFDLFAEQMQFFAHYVRDESEATPAVRYFVMGLNRWASAPSWPPPSVTPRDIYLRRSASGGDGYRRQLSLTPPPDNESADHFIYDPREPAPTIGGQTLLEGVPRYAGAGPRDQARLARRKDVVVYESPPIDADVEVAGDARLHLFATLNGPDGDFVASLVDIHPDDRELLVCRGILAARFRDGLRSPRLLLPGEVVELDMRIGSVSHCFRAGHRLAVYVTASCWPQYVPNPGNGRRLVDGGLDDPRTIRYAIFHDASRPSRVCLQVRVNGRPLWRDRQMD